MEGITDSLASVRLFESMTLKQKRYYDRTQSGQVVRCFRNTCD